MPAATADLAPAPPSPAVQASNAAQALRAVELLALERAAVRAATVPLRARLVAVQRAAAKAWIAQFGSLTAPGDPIRAAAVAAVIQGGLSRVPVNATAVLDGYTQRALTLGVTQGARATGTALTVEGIGATVDAPTARIVARLDQTVNAALAEAEAAAGQISGASFDEVSSALAKAHRAVPKVAAATITAVHGGANAGKRAVAAELGADVLWLAEPDCCTTCAGFAGRTTPAGEPFDLKHAFTFTDKPHIWPGGPVEQPPLHPHCFPAGVAASGPAVEVAFKRWYSGDLVEIRTAAGRVLPVTPNHPVLTEKGWIAAGSIHVGANLLCDLDLQAMLAGDPDDYQQEARIEQISGALRAAGGVATSRVPVAPMHFHGDGTDGEVDVVGTNRLLRHWRKVLQPAQQAELVVAADHSLGLARRSDPRSMGVSLPSAANRIMSSVRACGVLLRGLVRGDYSVRVQGGPQRDAAADEKTGDGGTGDAFRLCDPLDALTSAVPVNDRSGVDWTPNADSAPGIRVVLAALAETLGSLGVAEDASFSPPPERGAGVFERRDDVALAGAEVAGQLARAFAGLIELDKVVEVFRSPFSGHVYNLQTTGGWYVANGIIVHNCRCELVPYLGTEPGLSLPEALQREARRAIYKGWSLPSESGPERIRVARKLLARNTVAPKSVKAYSRRAVAAGRFPTRNVPHYTPRPRPGNTPTKKKARA